jgi:hypothetical protein
MGQKMGTNSEWERDRRLTEVLTSCTSTLLEGRSLDQDESEVDDKVCSKKDGLEECSASRTKIVLIHPVVFAIDATTVVTVLLR